MQQQAASVTPSAEGGQPGFLRRGYRKAQQANVSIGQRRGLIQQKLDSGQRLSKLQWGTNAVRTAVANGTENQQIFNHFRHAGLSQAIRFSIGAPAMPRNLEDYYRANLYQKAEAPEALYGEQHREAEPEGEED